MGHYSGSALYSVASIILAAALCACSSTVTPSARAQAPAAMTTTSLTTGTVVALRLIAVDDQNGSRTTVNNVLLALQQPRLSADFTSEEVVIRRSDGTAMSLIDRNPGLVVGNQVDVITSPAATIVHRD